MSVKMHDKIQDISDAAVDEKPRWRIEMANELRKRTHKDYTCWDLNCPQYVHVKNRQKLEAKFKRKARRKMKQELRKDDQCST